MVFAIPAKEEVNRKMKKKILSVLIILVLIFMLPGCGSKEEASDDSLSIVTTIFPEFDWVKNILGAEGNFELTMLLDNGVDLHSYQPTADDIIKISNCDLFIYVGGDSDNWVEDALKEATNKDMIVLNLMDVLGDKVKEEEEVAGMEAAEEATDEKEYDEHVWLSLKNAEIFIDEITKAICSIDNKNASAYKKNAEAYIDELNDLDNQYEEAIKRGTKDTLLFGDRFPFRYLVDDYNLKYYAAFSGCSTESEASFETIVFLEKKLKELGLPAIIKLESETGNVADEIAKLAGKNFPVLVMDSMQSTTMDDITSKNANYISIMKSNLEVLKQALA